MVDQSKRAASSGSNNQADQETRLSVVLPASIVRATKVHAAERGMTLRAIVLTALQAIGVKVPPSLIADRRAEANRLKGKARRVR